MFEDLTIEEIVEDLVAPQLLYTEFIEQWVNFGYKVFPSFDQDDLDEFFILCQDRFESDLLTSDFYDHDHMQLIKRLKAGLNPTARMGTAIDQGKKGEALIDGLCSDLGYDATIAYSYLVGKFGNEAARSLLRYQVQEDSENLSDYLKWLKIQNIFDFDKWQLEPPAKPPTNPTVINAPRARELVSTPCFAEEAWEDAPVISPEMAQRFPLLQSAMNRVSRLPEFDTAKPIMRDLVKQVVANGGGLNRHLVLLGPSGVGKSETAKILSYVLHSLDVVGPGMHTYLPAENAQKYVGYSEVGLGKILDRLSKKGGVLIIDEASSLYDGKHDSSANFRQRAAQVVQNRWEKLLDDKVVVIFAGYREGFENLMSTDEGWGRRLSLIDIEPPSVDRLVDKVIKNLNEEGIFYPTSLPANLGSLFQNMIEDDSRKFGYWGTVENFTLGLKASIAGDPLFGESEPKSEITADDFEYAARSIGCLRKDILGHWKGARTPQAPEHIDIPDSIGDLGWDRDPPGSTGMSPDR